MTAISTCELLHHGAAANSSPKVIACIPRGEGNIPTDGGETHEGGATPEKSELVYASHLMLNVASPKSISLSDTDSEESIHEKIWNVQQTLRTSTSLTEEEAQTAAANVSTRTAKRVITCVAQLAWISTTSSHDRSDHDVVLVCGFSDGTLTSWYRPRHGQNWEEHVLLKSTQDSEKQLPASDLLLEEEAVAAMKGRSITDIDGYVSSISDGDDNDQAQSLNLSVVTCSSGGAQYFQFTLALTKDSNCEESSEQGRQGASKHANINFMRKLIRTPSNSVKFHTIATGGKNTSKSNGMGVFLVGTAAPRHNKIHVFETSIEEEFNHAPKYSGSLTGHEDWITCFDWSKLFIPSPMDEIENNDTYVDPSDTHCYLASGSQDAKIRLWKWVTTQNKATTTEVPAIGADTVIGSLEEEDDDEEDDEVIEGEARLEIHHHDSTKNLRFTTSVYLEALLIGHEEMVTSVAWHPNPKKIFDRDLILFSSSMDRSIFIWCTTDGNAANGEDGVWTPFARVGSPSGILGGPVGSSLLGYLRVEIEPEHGRWIMGHAYGGALHFFSAERLIEDDSVPGMHTDSTNEKKAVVKWKAEPCITGHFDEVTDICWEAAEGQYLISVSNDATCRLWAPITPSLDTWIEISRPQVHGYSLSAVTSLSRPDHKHHLVTGADEKELRVFDGTKSFLRVLDLALGGVGNVDSPSATDHTARVDRAYMPSLGLSNKDTASDGADEDTGEASTSASVFPIERDLGSKSLWPETLKMYGHNSEIARLSSTLSARTSPFAKFSSPYVDQVLVASSTKARDVNTATIRMWDVDTNRCLQTLQGGHRSTVTAMGFSPDGTYFASSGKDRRLCVWRRHSVQKQGKNDDLFFLACAINSSHKRIVWSVHFCPYNPSILASGSRDGTVKLWNIIEAGGEDQNTSIQEYAKFVPTLDANSSDEPKGKPEAVTSLAFAPSTMFGTKRGIVAIGFENGRIQLWSVPIVSGTVDNPPEPPSLAKDFDPHLCHIGAIKKLAWRPSTDNSGESLVLASCSSDNGCRIYNIRLEKNEES